MSTWYGIDGRPKRATGVSGTVTFAAGARILQIHAIPAAGGGSVTILGDATPVTLPDASGWWGLQEQHLNLIAGEAGQTLTIVFAGTAAYFIEYIAAAGNT